MCVFVYKIKGFFRGRWPSWTGIPVTVVVPEAAEKGGGRTRARIGAGSKKEVLWGDRLE